MGIGVELREARQRAGLSADEVAGRTKVKLEKIKALEQEAFEYLPAGIYLDGIVRAYAQEVGVDPATAVAQLHSETAPVDEHPVSFAPELMPQHTIDTSIDRDSLDGFPAEAEMPTPSSGDAQGRAVPAGPRSAMPFVAYGLLALLAAFGIGVYLQSVTRSVSAPSHANATEQSRPPTNPAVTERPSAAKNAPLTAANNPLSRPNGSAPERAIVPDVSSEQPAARATSRDVTGAWRATTHVDSANYESYEGLRLGYRLQLHQNGNRVTGTGFKTTENGRAIPPRGRTPIALEGTTNGRELVLAFTEQGLRRPSKGQFTLTVTDDGTLRGRFDSDAARSHGTIEARRVR